MISHIEYHTKYLHQYMETTENVKKDIGKYASNVCRFVGAGLNEIYLIKQITEIDLRDNDLSN